MQKTDGGRVSGSGGVLAGDCGERREIVEIIKIIKKYWISIIAMLFIIFTLGIYLITFGKYGISNDSEQWDHFGSYVGGMFSALAFLGVVYQLQSAKQDQERQDFERTFFMMLEHHNSKLRFLEEKSNGKDDKSIIDLMYERLFGFTSFKKIRINTDIEDDIYLDINSYFLNLYRILKFINKNANFNIDNEYSSLLRSFLSRKVLLVLAYHLCERDDSFNEYISLVNKFHFLEHLDFYSLEANFISCNLHIPYKYLYEPLRNNMTYNEFVNANEIYWNALSRNLEKNNVSLSMVEIFFNQRYENKEVSIFNYHGESDVKIPADIFIFILRTFNDEAFKGNKNYNRIKINYKKFIDEK